MTQVDSIPGILARLADLVESADGLTYIPTPAQPSMTDGKRCPDSGAGSMCYHQWCIKNNDCLDRIARTQT
jgi:hypothetical protein